MHRVNLYAFTIFIYIYLILFNIYIQSRYLWRCFHLFFNLFIFSINFFYKSVFYNLVFYFILQLRNQSQNIPSFAPLCKCKVDITPLAPLIRGDGVGLIREEVKESYHECGMVLHQGGRGGLIRGSETGAYQWGMRELIRGELRISSLLPP